MSARLEYYANEFRIFIRHCGWSCGCSSVVAAIVFAIFFVLIGIGSGSVSDALSISIPISFSTLAVLFLFGINGYSKDDAPAKKMRWALMKQPSVSDEEFLSAGPVKNAELLLRIRESVAKAMDVPASKIGRDVRMRELLKRESYVSTRVALDVIDVQHEEVDEIPFVMDEVESIDELAERLAAIILKYRTPK